MDESAVVLNTISFLLTIVLARTAWKVGVKSGFVAYWRQVTVGCIVLGASRFILIIAETDHVIFSVPSLFDMKDVGLVMVIIGSACIVLGLKGFLKAVTTLGAK